ncbi:MAG: hypothetical protein ACM3YF_01070 [Candidatus Zixiibacteriota bacterium]
MKTLFALALLLAFAAQAFAQPDPRDSIILESKVVAPGAHPGASGDTAAYLYVRMSITNVDTLYALVLALQQSSVSGGAYATLGRPRNFNGVVNRLTNTLRQGAAQFARYNSSSPDSFLLAGVFEAVLEDYEPPNPVRKPFWELKFDSVWANPGTFELDTATILQSTGFTNTVPVDKPVNFVKSIISVDPRPKGDLNYDFSLSPADAAWILNGVMLGIAPPAGMAACDLNCDGQGTPADVVLELNAVFLGEAFPC